MGGKATDTNTGYTGGLTPYAQNLFGGSGSGDTSGGNTSLQNLGQSIMQASNKFSAQQGGPTEQAIAGIGNALVNKFNQPAATDTTPNLFGGTPPTFTPPNPFVSGTTNTGITNTLAPGSPISSPIPFNPNFTMSPAPPAKLPTLFG